MGKTQVRKWFFRAPKRCDLSCTSRTLRTFFDSRKSGSVVRVTGLVLEDSRSIIVAICNVWGILFGSYREFEGQQATVVGPNQSKPFWRKREERVRWFFDIQGVVYC